MDGFVIAFQCCFQESNTESPNPITGIVVSEPYETLMKKLSSKLKLMKNSKNDRKFTDQDLLNAVPLFSNLMSMMEEKVILFSLQLFHSDELFLTTVITIAEH